MRAQLQLCCVCMFKTRKDKKLECILSYNFYVVHVVAYVHVTLSEPNLDIRKYILHIQKTTNNSSTEHFINIRTTMNVESRIQHAGRNEKGLQEGLLQPWLCFRSLALNTQGTVGMPLD